MATREDIKRAYLKLGKAKGADNVSLSDIANEVGIRKASIYAHFESALAIRAQVLSDGMEAAKAIQPQMDFKAKDAGTLLYGFAENLTYGFSQEDISCFWAICCQLRHTDKAFAQAASRIEKMTEARVRVAIEFCVQKGWFNVPDTDSASAFFTARLLPCMTKAALDDSTAFDDLENLIDDSVELFS